MQWWEFRFRLGKTRFVWSVWLAEHIAAAFEKGYFIVGLEKWTGACSLALCLGREEAGIAPGVAAPRQTLGVGETR